MDEGPLPHVAGNLLVLNRRHELDSRSTSDTAYLFESADLLNWRYPPVLREPPRMDRADEDNMCPVFLLCQPTPTEESPPVSTCCYS